MVVVVLIVGSTRTRTRTVRTTTRDEDEDLDALLEGGSGSGGGGGNGGRTGASAAYQPMPLAADASRLGLLRHRALASVEGRRFWSRGEASYYTSGPPYERFLRTPQLEDYYYHRQPTRSDPTARRWQRRQRQQRWQ